MLPDWVSPWWQATLIPAQWDVCGVVVPPLSVWHTFALENVGNRYLCGGVPTMDDAASLLLFAARDMAHGQRLMLGDHYRSRAVYRLYRRLRKLEFADVDTACREYVTETMRVPRRWEKTSEGGGRCAVPYQVHLVRVLCHDYGLALNAAWNSGFAWARMHYDAAAEANGDTSIMRPEHEALDDEMYVKQQAELATAAGMN